MNESDGEKIKLELYELLIAIVDMPEAHHRLLLRSIISCDRVDVRQQTHEVAAEIIKLIPDHKKRKLKGLYEIRAVCPLCGGRGMNTNEGFKLDEGMRRHLTGDSNKGSPCFVMQAARRLATWSW
ncbi:hypothetical protein N9399_06310 [Porticoccaceae bacterium]|nr:hypothetical protein [Porticoccaceae bacterium]